MKPKVIHVISELNRGGTELSLVKLLPRLQNSLENHVVCLIGHGPVGDDLERAGINVHYLAVPGHFSLSALPRLLTLFQKLQPAGVVTYLLYADLVGRVAAKIGSLPVISAQRSSFHRRGYLRWPEQLTSFLVNHYIVQTDFSKRWIWSTRVTVIPNLVEVSHYSPPQSSSSLGKVTKVMLICVSNLRSEKGIDILLKAMVILINNYSQPTTHLTIIGDGSEHKNLESLAKELGISDQVEFVGSRTDVPELLAQADILVHPSPAEGMSNAILEAMAAGLPVIAADIPANRALITPNSNGIVFAVDNPQSLAEAVKKLINNSSARQRLGAAARQYVEQHHAPEKIVQVWRNVLMSVIINARTP